MPDLHPLLAARRALWTLRLRAARGVLEKFDALRHWQEFDAEATANLQLEHLERLLAWSQGHVPYYRTLLGHYGVLRRDGLDVERFRDLPLLGKDTIRTEFKALLSDDLHERDTNENTSGGSTGEPVRFVQDKEYRCWNLAVKMMFDAWAGYKPGRPKLVLWGAPRDLHAASTARARIGAWLRNERRLDAFYMPAGRMDAYLREIDAFRPSLILAYAQSLYQLAVHAEHRGAVLPSPDGIITSATTLHQEMRNTIERVFRTRVHDRYGSREVGDIACERGDLTGLAITAPTHYVEILRPDGTPAQVGESGEVVVTLLTNWAMPLVRYRIGDVAVAGEPTRAGGWTRLASVRGRVTSVFPTLSGGIVDGEYFTHLFYHRPWVREFQVVQERLDVVRLRVIPSVSPHDVDPSEVRELETKVREVMGADCMVQTVFTDQFERTPSGKHHYTISRVSPFDGSAARPR